MLCRISRSKMHNIAIAKQFNGPVKIGWFYDFFYDSFELTKQMILNTKNAYLIQDTTQMTILNKFFVHQQYEEVVWESIRFYWLSDNPKFAKNILTNPNLSWCREMTLKLESESKYKIEIYLVNTIQWFKRDTL